MYPKEEKRIWKANGLPRKGWQLDSVRELSEEAPCAWCGTMIYFEHTLYHVEQDLYTTCGCICAGHLSGDYAAPKSAEAKLKARKSRKQTWIDSPRWKVSEKGNEYRNDTPVGNIVIFSKPVLVRGDLRTVYGIRARGEFSQREFNSPEEAKIYAFTRFVLEEESTE